MTNTKISPYIDPSTLKFLTSLSKNNNRDWFNKHKDTYILAHANMCGFIDSIILEMNKHDVLENVNGKKSLYRIYNDVRFSKDKSPYNPRFAFSLKRAGTLRRGGYYMNIKPGNSFIACGFFAPNAEDLKRIRLDIERNYEDWYKLLNKNSIKKTFGVIQGKALLTCPKGFQKEHPAIELLRQQQFVFKCELTDVELTHPKFLKNAVEKLTAIRPFFNYMSEVLTSDLNGVSIY